MSAQPARKLLARGVFEAPYQFDGSPVLIAVDRFGNVRKHVKLRPGVNEQRATDWLWALLERIDPVPKLELHKPTPRHRPAREIDPRLYSDPRSPLAKRRYMQNLVKNAVRAMPRRPGDL